MANKKQVGEEFLQNTITEVAKLNLYRTWQRKVDYLFAFDAQAIFFLKRMHQSSLFVRSYKLNRHNLLGALQDKKGQPMKK